MAESDEDSDQADFSSAWTTKGKEALVIEGLYEELLDAGLVVATPIARAVEYAVCQKRPRAMCIIKCSTVIFQANIRPDISLGSFDLPITSVEKDMVIMIGLNVVDDFCLSERSQLKWKILDGRALWWCCFTS